MTNEKAKTFLISMICHIRLFMNNKFDVTMCMSLFVTHYITVTHDINTHTPTVH